MSLQKLAVIVAAALSLVFAPLQALAQTWANPDRTLELQRAAVCKPDHRALRYDLEQAIFAAGQFDWTHEKLLEHGQANIFFTVPEVRCPNDSYVFKGVQHGGFRNAQDMLFFAHALIGWNDVNNMQFGTSSREAARMRLHKAQQLGGLLDTQVEQLIARVSIAKRRNVAMRVDGRKDELATEVAIIVQRLSGQGTQAFGTYIRVILGSESALSPNERVLKLNSSVD